MVLHLAHFNQNLIKLGKVRKFNVDMKLSSSLLKKGFEVSRWATLIQGPSARRTKDSQPSGLGFEYCASHVRFRVFQQTARESRIRRDRSRMWVHYGECPAPEASRILAHLFCRRHQADGAEVFLR